MIICCITDIHGCLAELQSLTEKLKEYQDRNDVKWIFLGDYIDRGPDSKGVIDFLLDFGKHNDCRFLKGNHEDMMLDGIYYGGDDLSCWSRNGGGQTLASYPNHQITPEHFEFFKSLKMSYQTKTHFFCHAGVHPSYSLDDQLESDLLWIRQQFLKSPHDWGKMIVHGHSPLQSFQIEVKPNRINLDTGCVFGGFLTAGIFEDGEEPKFVQVPPI